MFRRTASRALLAVAMSVSLAACGGSDDDAESPADSTAAPTTQACEERPATAEPAPGVSADLAVKPEVPGSDAPPPCGLVISDVVVGTGAEAVAGTTAAVQYVGTFYETGEEFDASWSGGAPGRPLPVPVGQGMVIPGFEQAITGMQVGGRRIVTIPSELGYGDQDRGPIPGGSTLVFVLDLVEVSP
ncbi:FKBP-type peptidyl-prolyl cis-trans isomerase [Candidatus Blastococcus massiliensis]|uniref:FKBP-type peptidyl-prolyl cis-trans isomerase n=1 Tax=Candidatus Blastococcus massiliensis TaxID=1470358 RepID=UPI0004BC6810|nr:FKBP-type peptidyl-prolyl cis-trans isomerase [Candidatus Blastococcus massiliensis]